VWRSQPWTRRRSSSSSAAGRTLSCVTHISCGVQGGTAIQCSSIWQRTSVHWVVQCRLVCALVCMALVGVCQLAPGRSLSDDADEHPLHLSASSQRTWMTFGSSIQAVVCRFESSMMLWICYVGL
jgi:hypothetical protein